MMTTDIPSIPVPPTAEPADLAALWAKSADRGANQQPETLAQHTWAVVSQLAERIRLRPNLPAQLGVPRLWHVLFWAALLHDFGKAALGFQARLRKGPRWAHRHEVLSLAFVDWLVDGFSADERKWLVAAIASHHRDQAEIKTTYSRSGDLDGKLMQVFVDEIDDAVAGTLWDWLNQCRHAWIEALGLEQVVALANLMPREAALQHFRQKGAESIRKWLSLWNELVEDDLVWANEASSLIGTVALRGHLISADHMASAHVGDLLKPTLSDPQEIVRKLRLNTLYQHQQSAMERRGSAVLMAPTGSGKTEAALLWATAQGTPEQPVPRLFYTLPFQASMNAMERRFTEDDSDGRRVAPFKDQVGLEHSKSVLALYRKYKVDPTDKTLTEDEAKKQAVVWARQNRNLAKLHYFPVRILTPYQLLKAPYRLSGYEALLTDCFNATFVFDEIHAFEVGRLAIILATVKHLSENYGARFFVMSATLPSLLRTRLVNALGIPADDIIRASDDLYVDFRRHALILREGELLAPRALDRIAVGARDDQSVLVVCNTVKRAQKACDELRSRLGTQAKIILLHGRFNARDRLAKENIVREATGSRSMKRESIVLVATQVVEVSLDIDLDVIYTDPAPLEALLQRFGRINRRRLKECAPVVVFSEPDGGQGIYDESLVKASLVVLAKHTGQMIDEAQVSDWLDEVYADPQIAAKWNAEFDKTYKNFERDVIRQLRAFQSNDALEQKFYEAFDGVEVLPIGLQADYDAKCETEPLEASQLLVTLRWSQYIQLKSKGWTREESQKKSYPRVVQCYYDSEVGLDLQRFHTGQTSNDVMGDSI